MCPTLTQWNPVFVSESVKTGIDQFYLLHCYCRKLPNLVTMRSASGGVYRVTNQYVCVICALKGTYVMRSNLQTQPK